MDETTTGVRAFYEAFSYPSGPPVIRSGFDARLLLSYGALDDNVHPNATLLLIDALIKHNKDFDLLVFPKGNHRYGREPYSIRRTWDYFVRHLRNEEPPRGYKIEAPPS